MYPFHYILKAHNITMFAGFQVLLVSLYIDGFFAETVVTSNVGQIAGFQKDIEIDGKRTIITEFLGIPYGKDTSGQSIFRRPVPKAHFNGTFNAFTISLPCMQIPTEGTNSTGMTEDCLMLNIFVPRDFTSKTATSLLPVMIWVHG